MEENRRTSHFWAKVRDSLNDFEFHSQRIKLLTEEFIPRCFKIVEGDPEIIVLSDLKDQGCSMMDRFEGLDERNTLLVLNKIAKFHATSVAYKEQVSDKNFPV